MANWLTRLFGCRHRQMLREHGPDGWQLVCSCGHHQLLNPRDTAAPKPIGTWSEEALQQGRQRAEILAKARRKIAARRSMPWRQETDQPANVKPFTKAGR